jgi:uncharacterized membrane protein (UPF0127 family)
MTRSTPRALAVLAVSVVGAVFAATGCGSETSGGADPTAEPGPAGAVDTTESTRTETTGTGTTGTTGNETTGTADPGRRPEGFTTIRARVTDGDGETCEVCLWLADDSDERRRGLMGVTDLGDAVGMAFRFDEPTNGSFWMYDTPTPLSIAWFAPDGRHVGSTDMSPCIDTDESDCPSYAPGDEYDLAIEVFAGGLEGLGLGPGSSVELLDGTESETCPATP